MSNKIEIKSNGNQTDVSLRSVYGSGYITGIVIFDYDDSTDEEEEFYSVQFRYPVDSSDYFTKGCSAEEHFKDVRFETEELAVAAVKSHLEGVKIGA